MRPFSAKTNSLIGTVLISVLTGCATQAPPLANNPADQDQTLKLQLFLDSQHFGPGVVDGADGEFTTKAASLYQLAKGLPPDSLPMVGHIRPYASYTVTEKDLGALGTMALEPEEQSQQDKLPYTRLSELLAERFHTTHQFLQNLNPGADLNALFPGTVITVPNIHRPFRFDDFPSAYPAPSSKTALARRVIVDLQQKFLQVVEDGQIIAAFPITPGSPEHPAPVGEWRVVGSVPWPWYRYDDGVLSRGERTETFFNLPPGPNNPVGILWAGLNRPGVGIHGTPIPDTIGRAGSHGCIRLSNWDAATFHTLISKGTPITIQ